MNHFSTRLVASVTDSGDPRLQWPSHKPISIHLSHGHGVWCEFTHSCENAQYIPTCGKTVSFMQFKKNDQCCKNTKVVAQRVSKHNI